jgi:Xaa-Pro aminopeptidase
MKLFSTSTYVNRRNELIKQMATGVILINGNEEAPMNYKDNVYHFRQNSNFLYYFGIQLSNLNALIDCETGECIIYGHENTMDDIIWLGEVPALSELASRVGVSIIKPAPQIVIDLKTIKSQNRVVHYLPPYRIEHNRLISDALDLPIQSQNENASIPLIKAVVKQRSIKSDEEIVELIDAVNITRQMHLQAYKSVKPNKYEYESVGDILNVCKAYNAQLAYGVIFSINGQVLHNHSHYNKMKSGRLVINDSGAENAMCYAGDITRTIPVDGKFTSKQKDIYDIVYKMEESSIAALKPGVKYRDIHLHANNVLLDGLKDLGILHGDTSDMLEQGLAGLFMPHGLGHMMGLDVHDMEDLGENYVGYEDGQQRATYLGLKSLRLAKTLESGFVLTVEPGIYFIPQLIYKYKADGKFTDFVDYNKLDEFLDFGGVRIEDNVLITDTGYEVLGEHIPKTTEEVEEIMAS